ncbi:MAG: SulP family inorganic anion transporter [Xylophilus ampelinus]
MHPALHRWLPFLRWPRPDRSLLWGELMAGLTVGLMVVPQGVAYADLAGMPLVTGIYASLLPALVAVLFSSSARLSVGPTALSCLLVGAALTGLAERGSPEWVTLAIWLALLSGAMQLLLGVFRFGWLLSLVSSPVLTGFTQAAAWLILASQLPALLGFAHAPASLLHPALPPLDPASAAFGLGALAALAAGKRWFPRFPTVMVVMAASAAASAAIGFARGGGSVVGALPSGLPHLALPGAISWPLLGELLLPAMVVTLVSFLETASSAKVDNQRGGTRWDENQDLIGQGLAKIASGLSGAFPTSASFSRSAINLYAGARSAWATVFSVGVIVLALLWLMPALRHVPQAVLAAVVVAAITGLIRPSVLPQLWRVSRVEATIGLATFAITLATAPRLYWGVVAGLLMSFAHFLYQRMHPRIIELGLHADGGLRDRHLWDLPLLARGTLALRMDAALDFASAASFERAVMDRLMADPGVRTVYLAAAGINRVDATGAEVFAGLRAQLAARGVRLLVSGMKLPVEQVLRRAGALEPGPLLQLHRTEGQALAALASAESQELPYWPQI